MISEGPYQFVERRRGAVLRPTTVPEAAAEFSDANMIQMLYDMGALRDTKGKHSPLIAGAHFGNLETTRRMLEFGFDPNDDTGFTPLMTTVGFDHVDVVRELLAYGADCNWRDSKLQNYLFKAKSVPMADLLIDAGSRLDFVDSSGRTAVQYHRELGRVELAQHLVDRGATPGAWAPRGLNYEETLRRGDRDIREYLRETNPRRLEDYDLQESVDYGCVLPFRCAELV
jgi:ankyrin repeat protein